MQLPKQTQLLAASMLLVTCLLAGCDAFGDDGSCNGREGLFIETERNTYQAGGTASVTVENCLDRTLYIDRNDSDPPEVTPPDFKLDKMVAGKWEIANQRGSSLYDIGSDELEAGDPYEFTVPLTPSPILTDTVPGTYRLSFDISNNGDGFGAKDYLPHEMQLSNTFELTE